MNDLLDDVRPVERVPPSRVRWGGPRHRAPTVLRAVAGLLGFGAGLFTVALMWSDRAPGAIDRIFGERIRRLWERVDASGRAEFVTADRVPESDNLIHIAVWAVVTLLVGITVWSWLGLVIAGPLVVGASALVEVGQGRWADTRIVEASDVVANATGATLGVVAASLLYLCWSGVASLVRPSDRSRRR